MAFKSRIYELNRVSEHVVGDFRQFSVDLAFITTYDMCINRKRLIQRDIYYNCHLNRRLLLKMFQNELQFQRYHQLKWNCLIHLSKNVSKPIQCQIRSSIIVLQEFCSKIPKFRAAKIFKNSKFFFQN